MHFMYDLLFLTMCRLFTQKSTWQCSKTSGGTHDIPAFILNIVNRVKGISVLVENHLHDWTKLVGKSLHSVEKPFTIHIFCLVIVTTTYATINMLMMMISVIEFIIEAHFACNMSLNERCKSLLVAITFVSLERAFITQIYYRINFPFSSASRSWISTTLCINEFYAIKTTSTLFKTNIDCDKFDAIFQIYGNFSTFNDLFRPTVSSPTNDKNIPQNFN